MNKFCCCIIFIIFSSNLFGQEFHFIAGGNNSAEKTTKYVTVNSQSEFNLLLRDNNIDIDQLTKIDFDNKIVIAVFRGQCPSGGYGIRIKTVVQENDECIVEVILSDPGETCRTTMALTQPFAIYIVDKPSSKTVLFKKYLEIKDYNR